MIRFLRSSLLLALVFGLVLPVQGEETQNPWPMKLVGDGGEVIVYQPQIESLEGNRLEGRAAIGVRLGAEGNLIFGAMWFDCRISTDQDTRMASLEEVKVTADKFPDVDPEKVDRLSRYLEQEIPRWDIEISLDRLVASLPDAGGGTRDQFKNDPPRIYFRTAPAVLVLVDGDPIFTELSGFDLDYVVNSAFFIVRMKSGGQLFLRGGGMWFAADDLSGTWSVISDLPPEVQKVSKKVEEEEAAQAQEQARDAEALGVAKATDAAPPEIIVSTVPAELIFTAGEPDFASVEGTQLLYLKNTESDVVMDIASQEYFVLISGRWYRAPSLSEGPWVFVPFEDLPPDFAAIPPESDLGNVRVSVPGTVESREAVLESQIPQTAEIDRKTATVTVTYDGDPEFEKCGDGVAYALNTDKSVLLIDEKFYCVDSAVWFVSSGPEGPWAAATEVPALVQDLPPDCPVYNVKYVTIYDATPEVVYVGYTPGYYGSYVYGPCVIYGTGWYYRPWWGHYYYPRPVTYGFSVHYSSYGGWGFSFGMSYGWLAVGYGWGRPPYGCWGPAGYHYGYRAGYWAGYNHGYRHGYNNGINNGSRPGTRPGYQPGDKTTQLSASTNLYRDRKDGVKQTGDLGKQDRREPDRANTKNDVYTDRNGDVYRNNDGQWEKRADGEWTPEEGADNRDRDKDQKDRDLQDKDQKDKAQQDRDRQEKERQDRERQDRERQERDRQQQLERDRSARERGNQLQNQAPPQRQPRRGGRGRR